ncbi:UDP-N-acetylmuramoyl-tripeptide--D-alanyl-D-alanine ligase [Cognatishimia sp. WU-CL00825]|uniref:UDP-N-acetylmuramoyl-tripeptide--D-alanyl-D- alanine ligase n=1 Tax=Cognatishimia sp. WU-CL00825 TaxID=3127658 RepID=UPI003101C544
MMLWSSQEAAAATNGRATVDWACSGVSIDTRTLKKGDLFVALKAARDGHEFVAQALQNGAVAALVTHIPDGLDETVPLLIVDDALAALEDMARAARKRTRAKVVAVTGSVGKTSSKEMLRKVLGGQGKTHAAEASYNNHWGVPLTLARMPQDTEFAVIEIGMNHPGEIAPLAKMTRPHVALITTVAPAHMAAFESLEGIAVEKASIFDGLEDNGAAIYKGDLPVSDLLNANANRFAKTIVSFGENTSADFQLLDVRIGDASTVAKAQIGAETLLFKVSVPGRHFASNGLGVLAVADVLGLDRAIAIADLGQWFPGAGRGQREVIALDRADDRPTIELIDDAYNANPASLGAALEVLGAAQAKDGVGRVKIGRRIAYLGDMKELGEQEVAIHVAVANLPAIQSVDKVHCIGPLMKSLYEALPYEKRGRWTETSAEMINGLARDLDAGDVVLAKGSLSMGVGRVVDAIRKLGHPASTKREGTY